MRSGQIPCVTACSTAVNTASNAAARAAIILTASENAAALDRTVCIASGMILLPIAAGLCVKIEKRLRKQKKRADFEKPRTEVRIHSRSSYSRQI